MALIQPHLKYTISIGVGLAFEYFRDSYVAKKIEKFGLEWLYRCIQQPIKARRFIVPFLDNW